MTNTAPQLKNSSETDESLKTPTSPKIDSNEKILVKKLPVISRKDYYKIHKDFRGKYEGKRSAFAGSLRLEPYGTTLLIEDKHFVIK